MGFLGKTRREAIQQTKAYTEEGTNDVKTIVYGTIDTFTSVVDGVVTVARAVPEAIETVQSIPTTIREKKIETDREIARAKQSVDNFLAWRPLDDAQRAIVNTQRDVNEKIEGVKKFGGKLKSIIDPPPPPPPPPKPKSQAFSSPISVIKNSFSST